ncbi:hypothetical protein FGB62_166g057 [Gracilaria domingensis]|nr:hypothetical protein FGB62_166g057 [Gracilaria domingensis]
MANHNMFGRCPAFVSPTPLSFSKAHLKINVCNQRSKMPQKAMHRNRRARLSMIVRKEMGSLERDYMELAKLGTRYQTFDRQGKHMFIDSALDVVDRFAIFLTRLKLSDEFSAQMFIKQYSVKLQEYGLTIDSLIENTKRSLEMMRAEIPEA